MTLARHPREHKRERNCETGTSLFSPFGADEAKLPKPPLRCSDDQRGKRSLLVHGN